MQRQHYLDSAFQNPEQHMRPFCITIYSLHFPLVGIDFLPFYDNIWLTPQKKLIPQ